ncbi:hypothetical protein [Aliiglaciecola sp. LCG003]|uniref:hypothetical protein n=1 Tax=Aliiglaciecola sp. LCG003 TaxID=3053655 RepID=UPI00257248D2|nr:hypothetical protein [Aliiglaciecola sp. LCG003]WJG07627.1 hypothetical protein QR722_09615 [Aliiglaciecola sp. LCG003]
MLVKIDGAFNRKKVIHGSPILAVISTDSDSTQSWINTYKSANQPAQVCHSALQLLYRFGIDAWVQFSPFDI